jgi:hypothetical protein
METPFPKGIDASAPFFTDDRMTSYNGAAMPMQAFNLACSRRDLKLFCAGLKPHRAWTLRNVKAYYGLSGSKEKCLAQIEALIAFFEAQQQQNGAS